jgi:multicomponent Na+:H+ antiporter subunit D
MFLSGTGLLYGMTGTLNMADLSLAVREVENQALLTVVAVMFMIAFGVKAALFPLFFWLPASYHTPAFSVSAVFAGLLTKVGVYALIRMFTLVFVADVAFTHGILLWVACFTMVVGVLGAAAQSDFRKILSFHIVSQIGYMILGLALFTPLAIVGAVFYLVHHIIVKANLFLVSGVAHRLRVHGPQPDRRALQVLAAARGPVPRPGLLARGLPAAVGLLGEVPSRQGVARYRGMVRRLRRAGRGPPHHLLHDEDLGRGVLEAASRRDRAAGDGAAPRAALAADAAHRGACALTVFIGLNPEPFVQFAERAADQLLNPADYVTTVLGAQP